MKKIIKTDSFYFSNSYISGYVCYDYLAGKKNRYYLLILTDEDPFIAGREVDLKFCKLFIKYLFKVSKEFNCMGDKKTIEKIFIRARQLLLKDLNELE